MPLDKYIWQYGQIHSEISRNVSKIVRSDFLCKDFSPGPAFTPCVPCELNAGDVLKLGNVVGVHVKGSGAGGVAAQLLLRTTYLCHSHPLPCHRHHVIICIFWLTPLSGNDVIYEQPLTLHNWTFQTIGPRRWTPKQRTQYTKKSTRRIRKGHYEAQ